MNVLVRFGSAVNCPIAESLPSGFRACSRKPLNGVPVVDVIISFSFDPGAILGLPGVTAYGDELCWAGTLLCFGDKVEQVLDGAPDG